VCSNEMLVLNETVQARDNIFERDYTYSTRLCDGRHPVSGDNNRVSGCAKKKLSALNREFLKSLGFVVRKDV